MSQLRLVFAGTPDFAVPSLQVAHQRGELLAVYTQPDRPAGRGRALTASPIKQAAQRLGLPIEQPLTLRDQQIQQQLAALEPDLLIVVAYGLILPAKVLAIPRFGCWNVHASLLPRWRGAAPIQRAIEAGDQQTGVCLMQMEKGLDTGPVLLSQKIAISDTDTSANLHDKLAQLGAQVLDDGLGLLRAGLKPQAQPQAVDAVTYAHKIEKQEARLDWQQSADALARKVRAFVPWPITEAQLVGERVRIHAAEAISQSHHYPPGHLISAHADGIDMACAQGVLRLLILQRDGGKPMTARDYLNARSELRG